MSTGNNKPAYWTSPGFLFPIGLLMAILTACSPGLRIYEARMATSEGNSMAYALSEAKGKKDRKLLVFLPGVTDTADVWVSGFFKRLYTENFQILIPEKRGTDYSEQRAYDHFSTRLYDIEGLVAGLVKKGLVDTSTHVVVMGAGEGAYLVPQLARSVSADGMLLVNNGPLHFLQEVRWLLEGDTANPKVIAIKEYNLMSASQIKTFVEAAHTGTPYPGFFYGKASANWHSYTKRSVVMDLYSSHIPAIQLYGQDYPVLSDTAQAEFLRLTQVRYPRVHTHILPAPFFSRKALDEDLWQVLSPVFTPR